ncbi:MAG: caspase domain-containing protein [Mesorhizobium sp.]
MARYVILILAWFVATSGFAQAGLKVIGAEPAAPKLALVVGVADYQHLPRLKNTVNDARLVARSLEDLGFKVTRIDDPDRRTFEAAIRDHADRIGETGNAVSVFYYAGQGFEIDRTGYMVASDARLADTGDVADEAVSIEIAMQTLSSANPDGVSLFLLDSCRDNPFSVATRGAAMLSEQAGANRRSNVKGTLVAYAVGPGGVAEDGTGDNGPFALAIARALAMPGLNQSEWFREVRNATLDATGGRQVPTISDNLTGDFMINPAAVAASPDDLPETRAARAVYEVAPGVLKPTYEDGSYALLIGVGDYDMAADGRQAWRDLPAVRDELERLGDVLERMHGFEVETVFDPTSIEIETALKDFVNRHGAKPNARLVFMLAGHGTTTESFGKKTAWFVPRDAPAMNPPAPFRNTALNLRRVEEWSEVMEAKHVLWIFDSCFSGAAIKMIESRSGEAERDGWTEHLHANPVRRVITSGSENEEVPAKSRFAERLIDVLSGKVPVGGGTMVTGGELGAFLREDVIRYNFKQGLPKVTPQSDTIVIPGDEGDIVFRIEPQLAAALRPERTTE